MPKRTDLEHVLVIGSGPILIGQARVHPTSIDWLTVDGHAARSDGHSNTVVACPVPGDVILTSQELARAANRVRRRFRSVGLLVNPRA